MGSPRRQPSQPPDRPGDVFSARDAARRKGVAYSTALRAIRDGRLPATRFGRTLLVTAADLANWEPRQPMRLPLASPVANSTEPTPMSSGSEAAARLEWLATVLSPEQGQTSLDAIGQRLVTDLGVGQVVAWRLDRRGQRLVRLVSASRTAAELPESLSLRELGPAISTMRRGLQPFSGRPGPVERSLDEPWNLAAPVRFDRQLVGLVTVTGAGGQAALTDDARRWADLLVGLIAGALAERHRTAVEDQRDRQLQAVLDSLSDPAAIADETGRTLISNRSFQARFGLVPGSLAVGVDLPTLLGQAEQLAGTGGKRSVVPRLRAALAGREATTLPLLAALPAGQGTARVVVTPVNGDDAEDDGGPLSASLVRLGRVSRPDTTVQSAGSEYA